MSRNQLKDIADNHRPIASAVPAAGSNAGQVPRLFNVTFPRKVALFTPIKPPEYIGRIARIVLDQTAEEGERFLRREMVVVTENLVATGADPATVHREVRKLEAAIRTELWQIVMNAGAPR
jgi:hypothetical protein